MPRSLVGLASLCWLASVASAHAQTEVRSLPLRAPSPAELSALEPWLPQAIVAHVEQSEYVELPQVTVIAEAAVRCGAVLAVARDVASYPAFMPALDGVTLAEPSGDGATAEVGVGYDWTWNAAILSFRGSSTVTVLGGAAEGPPGAAADVPFRVVLESIDGDLGRARRTLRGTPREGGRCLLVLTGRHDARNSNYLTSTATGTASGTGLALSRALSLVLSIATVTRFRGEAERRAGHARAHITDPLGDPRALAVDPRALAPWVDRGETFVLETSDGSDLGAIVGLSRLTFTAERVRSAFFDPVHFTVGLLSGASITEVGREGAVARYRWAVDVPLLGSSGELSITDVAPDEVELLATAGAMDGGRIVLTTIPDEATGFTYARLAARIDPADGVPIVAAIESTDAAFRPGLVATGLLMAFRGLRRGLIEGH